MGEGCRKEGEGEDEGIRGSNKIPVPGNNNPTAKVKKIQRCKVMRRESAGWWFDADSSCLVCLLARFLVLFFRLIDYYSNALSNFPAAASKQVSKCWGYIITITIAKGKVNTSRRFEFWKIEIGK